MYSVDFSVLLHNKEFIIQGVLITLFISFISSICAFLIGLFTAFLRHSDRKILKFLTVSFIEMARNVPLLIHIYLVYKALPQIGIVFSPMICGIIALSIYTGAYMAEVLRSGINSIERNQIEAAKSLGLNRAQAFRLIILPQALRIVISPMASQFINLIKNSSLVSFIAVADLFYVIYKGAADEFRIYEYFVMGVVIYAVITGIVALIGNILEAKFTLKGRGAKI